jgi:hypothetical protein
VSCDAPVTCAHCGAAIQQSGRGRARRYCSPACRKAAHRSRATSWAFLQEHEPQRTKLPTPGEVWSSEHPDGQPVWGADCQTLDGDGLATLTSDPVPSPEDSTVSDVAATIIAACAVVSEFRRHGLAAEGLVAVKCAHVAAAIDEALSQEFGEILES